MAAIRIVAALDAIDSSTWNALAGDDNPFVSHAFLSALEATGCIRSEFGWQPSHLILDEDGKPAAAMPLYVKHNSHGEFVFDWAWADAWERAGGAYYPKLLCAVPYSPVTGPRLLAGSGPHAGERRRALTQALAALTRSNGLSSAHVDFIAGAELDAFGDEWLERSDWQFHWRNDQGWRDMADFLSALTHRRRKAIRQERAQVERAGIACEWRNGGSLSADEWRAMHALYTHTFDEKGNTPTLSARFFRTLGERFPAHSHVAFARRGEHIVAGALFLSSRSTLYGRYWGAFESVPALHFELCYYQGIEHCLRSGLTAFEPGAQGAHKLARGFLPVATHSRHWIADPGFRAAVRHALRREASALERRHRDLMGHSPFARHGTTA